ncbi:MULTISPECIES: DUF397 domain-containing protein [unclassified Streptomyces]|uniref:DUF397 domain-containing protein n=1 Tax=Streptomyces lonegramiae TaxID=3075524 RepID=A0ABU2XIJ0_9ACTN|nr:DUF397 domain-containing protein [Streptomyces sp. DSM 41529]MDT0544915.1 DUF397 domain-containing protein [Streptomyces sp. DSM 41529]
MTPPLERCRSSYSSDEGPDCAEVATATADATVHVRDAKDVQGGRLSFVDRSRIAFDKICSGQPGHPVWRTSLEPGGGVRTDAGCGYDSAETHRCGGPRCFR